METYKVTKDNVEDFIQNIDEHKEITSIVWSINGIHPVFLQLTKLVSLEIMGGNYYEDEFGNICFRNENEIRYPLENLTNCTELQHIECCGSLISSLKGIENCKKLKTIDFSCNRITSLHEIKELYELEEIDCYENEITSLDDCLYLTKLKKINFRENKINSLHGIQNCNQLESLNVSLTGITSLLPIQNFTMLTKLSFDNNNISTLKEIKRLSNLVDLSFYNTKINTLKHLKYFKNLTYVDCSNNELTSLQGIENCVHLVSLHCLHNKLTSLEGIEKCVQLLSLKCIGNQITSLQEIENCVQLIYLDCYDNKITSLRGIEKCINLKILICAKNELTSLQGIENCMQLLSLECYNNKLTTLCDESNDNTKGIACCTMLAELNCSRNQITSLVPLLQLQHLYLITYNENPIEMTIQTQHFLERIEDQYDNENSIYKDTQNVHDSKVQKTIFKSIQHLIKDKNVIPYKYDDLIQFLKKETVEQLLFYLENEEVHSYYLLTFKELFEFVWNRIICHEHKEELYKRLDEEMKDAECKCFTGCMNRLVNVLSTYYDDIHINISNASQIGAIIINEKNKLIDYDSDIHFENAKEKLLDLGYPIEEIQPWLDEIKK